MRPVLLRYENEFAMKDCIGKECYQIVFKYAQ